jgi:hypothetical protein
VVHLEVGHVLVVGGPRLHDDGPDVELTGHLEHTTHRGLSLQDSHTKVGLQNAQRV